MLSQSFHFVTVVPEAVQLLDKVFGTFVSEPFVRNFGIRTSVSELMVVDFCFGTSIPELSHHSSCFVTLGS